MKLKVYVSSDTRKIILEMIFPANILASTKKTKHKRKKLQKYRITNLKKNTNISQQKK